MKWRNTCRTFQSSSVAREMATAEHVGVLCLLQLKRLRDGPTCGIFHSNARRKEMVGHVEQTSFNCNGTEMVAHVDLLFLLQLQGK